MPWVSVLLPLISIKIKVIDLHTLWRGVRCARIRQKLSALPFCVGGGEKRRCKEDKSKKQCAADKRTRGNTGGMMDRNESGAPEWAETDNFSTFGLGKIRWRRFCPTHSRIVRNISIEHDTSQTDYARFIDWHWQLCERTCALRMRSCVCSRPHSYATNSIFIRMHFR